MWRMLQQDAPDDYVIATGEPHALRNSSRPRSAPSASTGDEYVDYDPKLSRPATSSSASAAPKRPAPASAGSRAPAWPTSVTLLIEEELRRPKEG